MLRLLFPILILSSIGCWSTDLPPSHTAENEALAAAAITKLGGEVEKDLNAPGQPIIKVSIPTCTCLPDDSHLAHLESLTNLRQLQLRNDCKSSNLTDKGLIHLQKLTKLEHLQLGNSGGGPGITDAGLLSLRGLTNLRELVIDDGSGVSEAGIKELQKSLPNLNITRNRQ